LHEINTKSFFRQDGQDYQDCDPEAEDSMDLIPIL